ncbi:MAG: anti-sigma factor antagonist [Ignavibacteria bacterium]|nr:MAG: anti-sigma factor antagonist [Ignavibacteria bacterium]
MEDFEKQLRGDVLIEKVNLLKATIMEANIIKTRLFEDILLNNKKIIVDISNCDFIDSTFLGVLVASLKRTIEIGGDIKIAIASSSFAEGIVNNSGILRVFEIYTSVEDALESFRLYGKEPQSEFINHIYYLCKKYDYKN